MPWRAYLLFIISVFFIFSIFGFAVDLVNNMILPVQSVIFWCIYCGLVASGFAYSFTRNIKALPYVIIFMLIFMFIPVDRIYPGKIVLGEKGKQIFDGVGIYITVVLGYIFFITFVTLEGIKQVRMRTEMDLAESMHQVLVPPIEYKNDKIDVYGKSNPTLEIGGDLIDFVMNDKYSTAYIADVSGHGIDAGLLMGMFKAVVLSKLSKDNSIVDTINEVNKVLNKLKKPGMFVTCSIIRIYPDDQAEFLTAGHLPILQFCRDTKTIKQLLIKQIPIAVKEDFQFTSGLINYSKGDVFVFLTDGIIEVMNDKGEEFGLASVEELILRKYNECSKEIFNTIFELVNIFGKMADDQSSIIIKVLK